SNADEDMDILEAVEKVNQVQRENFFYKVRKAAGGHLSGQKIALWGVAFKPGTDDIREAPALYLIEKFLAEGATVSAYDPVAAENAREHFKADKSLTFKEDQYDVLDGASVLVVATEWKSFREPDYARMKAAMKKAVICDGRNIYNPRDIKGTGFKYYSVGRPNIEAY
ncbi:MAG: UDP binding domain-containing protein, partial [Bdellovibrio sp.]